MASSGNSSFCFWVVSPKDGSIRRIKLTSLRVMGILLFLVAVVGGALYLASDYSTLQLKRAQDFFALKQLNKERDNLYKTNRVLTRRVRELETTKDKVVSYEKDIRQRMAELLSVLRIAESFGVVDQDELRKLEGSQLSKGAMGGGVDIECNQGQKNCFGVRNSSFDAGVANDLFSLNKYRIGRGNSENLAKTLERCVTLLRSLPVGIPVRGQLTSRFGVRRSPFSGRLQLHGGMDWSAPSGTKIIAPADGVVKKVSRDKSYGISIELAHSGTVSTVYGHLSGVKVHVGDKVKRGTVIGLVGSTGRSTGSHLHYELRVRGKAKDPGRMLALGQVLNRAML